MDKPQEEDVRLTLRISRDLYDRIVKLARGNGRRPAAKVNPTIGWLLEKALDQAEKDLGQKVPARRAA